MLQYLVILLDDSSVSYCHYNNKQESNLMPIEVLKKGIMFAMKNDLKIQYILPDYTLQDEYVELIESMFHDNIGPLQQESISSVVVVNHINELLEYKDSLSVSKRYVLRTSINDFFINYTLLEGIFINGISVNVVFTDIESFSDDKIGSYASILENLSSCIEKLLMKGCNINTNLITDRIALDCMNNCGAGDTSITLAPNGKFYACPAFYYDEELYFDIGNIEDGVVILNENLYKLAYSPLCRRCDAYQCKRCVWLNKKLTYEINTPSRQQCVISHIERNASKSLLDKFHQSGFLIDKEIKPINYIDPFDNFQSI